MSDRREKLQEAIQKKKEQEYKKMQAMANILIARAEHGFTGLPFKMCLEFAKRMGEDGFKMPSADLLNDELQSLRQRYTTYCTTPEGKQEVRKKICQVRERLGLPKLSGDNISETTEEIHEYFWKKYIVDAGVDLSGYTEYDMLGTGSKALPFESVCGSNKGLYN